MGLELRAFLVLILLSVAVPVILFLPLRASLRRLLQQTVKAEAGVTFYLGHSFSFFSCLLFRRP